MKKKKSLTIILLMLCLVLLASGTVLVVSMREMEKEAKTSVEVVNLETFAAWTDIEEFSTVPAMQGSDIKYGEAADYGDDHYVIDVNGTTVEEYLAYLELLEETGFVKHSDNGEDAMEGYVMTSSFTYHDLTLTVSHAINLNKTYISAVYDLALSDRLIYDDSYLEGITEGAVTKFHNVELNNNGNGFIYELKNGHFVIFDGGAFNDTPYFWDYLMSLVPEGEKPVIEGWFVSHAHGDHHGVLLDIAENEEYRNNIIVDGIYFVEPTDDYVSQVTYTENSDMWKLERINSTLTAQDGGKCGYYRPQLGQRYYFCDIYIDVCLTVEQFPLAIYYNKDFNETCTWLMVTIDEQKMLVAGDARNTGMMTAMEMYDEAYFTVDIYVAFHHGINVYDYWTDFITFTTLIYPSYRDGSIHDPEGDYAQIEENKYLQEKAVEYYSRKNGTTIFAFPYQVGTVETLEPCEWQYNEDGKPIRTYGDAWAAYDSQNN